MKTPLPKVVAALALSVLTAVGLGLVALSPAAAVQEPHDRVVSDVPAAHTPHVLDGRVNAVVQIGDTVILGGRFSEVSSADGSTVYERANVVAFSASTGTVSDTFVPDPDAEVMALAAAPDGQSIFIGGFFDSVAGTSIRSLAKLRIGDGEPVAGFTTPVMTGRVKDLRLADDRLWVAGTFTHVAGGPRRALATLDPDTGARDDYQSLVFAGNQNGGATQVMKIDITPDGSRLVAIGNFASVDDEVRRQVVMLDLTGGSAQLADWDTSWYEAECSSSFQSYMRDVDISPDGEFFVIVTTGAYRGGPPRPCDTAARFEVGSTGGGLVPTWVDYTGGDTTLSVAVTGTAVYTGGHFRWQNNPHAGDRAGAGAVGRQGLTALDPGNGLPLRWDPGRTLGVGVFDLLATDEGLWVASDTDRIANWRYRGRIAFFPLDGGTGVPPAQVGGLPGDVYRVPAQLLASTPERRPFDETPDGTTVGDAEPVNGSGVPWQQVRGAFMLGTELYTGLSNGEFTRRDFDGSDGGAPTSIDTADQLVTDSAWHGDVANLTGLAYADGKMFYTRSGQNTLYYRYYTRESDVVGAQRLAATGHLDGFNWSAASGLFIADGHLYVGHTVDGNLRRWEFADGQPVEGTMAVVSGPSVDGHDWRSRAAFLFVGDAPPPNEPPVAEFTVSCAQRECAFDGSASSDPDGEITEYAWSFGDGHTASDATTAHTYDADGSYEVSLTVTDDRGATHETSQPVAVSSAPESTEFVGADNSNNNSVSHQVDVPAEVEPGDLLVLFATFNTTGVTIADPSGAGWSELGTETTRGMVSKAWSKTVEAGDAGSTITVATSDYAKADVSLAAYAGDDLGVEAVASTSATGQDTGTSPEVAGSASSWLVTYWGHKSSAATAWDPLDSHVTRASTVGSGGGRIAGLLADSDGATGSETAGGVTASIDATGHMAVWSVLVGGSS